MTKPLMVIRGPVGTRSGYGDMSRDIVRHFIELDRWDVKVLPCPWGECPMNSLSEDNPKDKPILDRIIIQPNFPRQPEIFVSITVPNEFNSAAKYNIGITAGIETTACSAEWISGMNKMDLILTISEHSKAVLSTSAYEVTDNVTKMKRPLRLEKPIEVLHNCVDTNIFHRVSKKDIEPAVVDFMKDVKESFAFLVVGRVPKWRGASP